MTEKEAIDFCKNDPESAAKIIMMVEELKTLVAIQTQKIKELEAKLNRDSTNSSKPPSTDNKLKKPKKPNAPKSKKLRGGQVGSKGNTLRTNMLPDTVEVLLPFHCECCSASLENIDPLKIEKRQLFDIPKIDMYVTEYQAHSKVCPKCNTTNKPLFPNNVNASTQYGENLKSFVAYLNSYQMLPYKRITELIEDLVSHKIATGTVYNFLNTYYDRLENFENDIKKKLLDEDVINSDETGINIQGKLHWIHVASSSYLTYYMLHKKRGKDAMDDMEILPRYGGIAVHDHWASYNHYNCIHSYCNAHLLRELNGVTEKENCQWSQDMHSLLTNMNSAVHKAKESNKKHLSSAQIEKFSKNYEKITKGALKYYPPPDKTLKKSRGRIKQEKGKNLLDRLLKYQDETLRFLSDFRVPFTNNLAERDLRMIKVKEKISGTFMSFKGGEIFCRIRSYISTLKKNNVAVLQGLQNVLRGNAYSPFGVGTE